MLNENTTELFVELSDEQQQIVAGGGPTLGIVADLARFTTNTAPVFSASNANAQGANSTGLAIPAEIDSLAAQAALSAAGIPNLAVPSGLSYPSGGNYSSNG